MSLLLSVLSPCVKAQQFPNKPIKFVVFAPAGGAMDMLARMIGERLSKNLGQPIIVDNRPGAMGALAMDAVLSAPHDGYTYLLAANSLVTELPYTLKPKYDPFKDIKPLVELTSAGLVLVANASLPANNLPEFVRYAKENEGKISFASFTPGSVSHILGLQLNKIAGLDMQHIGYKGSPPAMQDLMGGQVQVMFNSVAPSIPFIKSGKMKAYMVTSPTRSRVLPEVLTAAEAGFPALTQTAGMMLWTVPNVPASIKESMRKETLKVLSDPVLLQRLLDAGLEIPIAPRNPEEISQNLLASYKGFGDFLRSINYIPE